MLNSTTASFALGLALLLAVAGCGGKAAKVNAPGQGGISRPEETPPGLNDPTGPSQVDPNDAIKDNKVLDVVMRVKASALGINACNGDLGLALKLQFDPNDKSFRMIEIPKDTIQCLLVGPIGLKQMLEGAQADPSMPQPPKVDKPIVEENNVIGFKLFTIGLYEPPRPFLPAFISADADDLKKINVSRQVTVTDWYRGNKQYKGTITAKTLRYQKDVAHGAMGRHFQDVYDFEFKNEGFEGADRINMFLFDRMMIRIALKPFAPLRLELQTSVSKLMAGLSGGPGQSGQSGQSGLGGTLNGITGMLGNASGGILSGGLIGLLGELIQVNMEGDLIEMKSLPPPGDESSDDGVVTKKKD